MSTPTASRARSSERSLDAYGREGENCRRCGAVIRRERFEPLVVHARDASRGPESSGVDASRSTSARMLSRGGAAVGLDARPPGRKQPRRNWGRAHRHAPLHRTQHAGAQVLVGLRRRRVLTRELLKIAPPHAADTSDQPLARRLGLPGGKVSGVADRDQGALSPDRGDHGARLVGGLGRGRKRERLLVVINKWWSWRAPSVHLKSGTTAVTWRSSMLAPDVCRAWVHGWVQGAGFRRIPLPSVGAGRLRGQPRRRTRAGGSRSARCARSCCSCRATRRRRQSSPTGRSRRSRSFGPRAAPRTYLKSLTLKGFQVLSPRRRLTLRAGHWRPSLGPTAPATIVVDVWRGRWGEKIRCAAMEDVIFAGTSSCAAGPRRSHR